jgi:hypothetical protein
MFFFVWYRYLLRRAGVEKSSYAGAVIDFSME